MAIKVPTQGHILTALDYLMHRDQAERNATPPGVMAKLPPKAPVPAGWVRATGQPFTSDTWPRLYPLYQGQLPNDPEWIIKL